MTVQREYDSDNIHMWVFDNLLIGEENAILSKDLARKLDITPRQLRDAIEKERAAGALICSSNKGYFRGKNRDEIAATYNHLRKRALGTLAMIKTFSDYLGRGDDPFSEQLTLADFMNMNP